MTLDTITVSIPRTGERVHTAVSWDAEGIAAVEVLEVQTAAGLGLYGLAFEGRARQLEEDEAFRSLAFNMLCIHYSSQPPNKDDGEDVADPGQPEPGEILIDAYDPRRAYSRRAAS